MFIKDFAQSIIKQQGNDANGKKYCIHCGIEATERDCAKGVMYFYTQGVLEYFKGDYTECQECFYQNESWEKALKDRGQEEEPKEQMLNFARKLFNKHKEVDSSNFYVQLNEHMNVNYLPLPDMFVNVWVEKE